MKKLVNGIVAFRKKLLPAHRENFARLALGQSPDALFIVCSDSRVAPNVFASTDPGDLFVVRNVGNMIPPSGGQGISVSDESELAALEFAIFQLKVKNIIICGHSECGAMQALYQGRDQVNSSQPHLKSWLVHGEGALKDFNAGKILSPEFKPHNCLSQLNVLHQLEHVLTYSFVKERVDAGTLGLHGWWFDIANADVYAYDKDVNKFLVFDDDVAKKIMNRLEGSKG